MRNTITLTSLASAGRNRPMLLWLAVACFALLGVGCESTPTGDMAVAQQAYRNQNFETALDEAAVAARQTPGLAGDEAAYIAGLSAQQLGRYNQAKLYLGQAAASEDRKLSGDAYGALGLLHTSYREYGHAANALLNAAERLDGHDKANAYFYAALAQQRLGQWSQARTSLILARGAGPDADLMQRIAQQMQVTGFTVQTGAYGTRENADRAAQRLAERVAGLEIGTPVVVEATAANGQRLYLVQVGQFVTYSRAVLAKSRVQMDSAIVVPLTRS